VDAPYFSCIVTNMYEKYSDVLVGSPLLFVCDDVCVKCSKSIEVHRSGAPCFLYVAMHM
jgi:hypothetical protein